MINRLLQEGDVIEIKEGHTIYADVPKHFVFVTKTAAKR